MPVFVCSLLLRFGFIEGDGNDFLSAAEIRCREALATYALAKRARFADNYRLLVARSEPMLLTISHRS